MKDDLPSEALDRIAECIHTVRGQRVMLDADLAAVYGVLTRNLNKAVKRNADRFPEDFVFQLTRQEVANLKFQIGTSSLEHGGRRKPSWVYGLVHVLSGGAFLPDVAGEGFGNADQDARTTARWGLAAARRTPVALPYKH